LTLIKREDVSNPEVEAPYAGMVTTGRNSLRENGV